MLHMHIADNGTGRATEDLTRREQILSAAIDAFAHKGNRASVREIAAKAGVSPGLITHHFGSKEQLRKECDDAVLREYRDIKLNGADDPIAATDYVLAHPENGSIISMYSCRAFLDGGKAAGRFMDQFLGEVRVLMKRYEQIGMVKPTRREEARARYLTYAEIGSMLIEFVLSTPKERQHFTTVLAKDPQMLIAQFETLTYGMFSDDSLLRHIEQLDSADDPNGSSTSTNPTTKEHHD